LQRDLEPGEYGSQRGEDRYLLHDSKKGRWKRKGVFNKADLYQKPGEREEETRPEEELESFMEGGAK